MPIQSGEIRAAISPDPFGEFAPGPPGERGEFMHCVIVTLIAVVLSATASAAPVRPLAVRQLEVAPKEVILGWINQYRPYPEPDKVPLAVHGMSRLGGLTVTEGAGI